MSLINTAYTYYLTTYGNTSGTRYGAHKKNELRDVYNRMVKVNKNSPLYKFNNKSDVVKFAIDIKENAQHVRNVVSSISDSEDIMKSLQKKIAASSQEDVVSAAYVGTNQEMESDENFTIEVQQLAEPQVNIGNFLDATKRSLAPGNYSFDLSNASAGYEFQFNVNPEDTNYSIQERISRLINNSDIGLSAEVLENDKGESALQIESVLTGRAEEQDDLFRIRAGGSENSETAIGVLGIDRVQQEAKNSSFLLNGIPQSSSSNQFILNNTFALHLKATSPQGIPATVGFKPDSQAAYENIRELTDAYNTILTTGDKYSETQSQARKLQYQIGSVANYYRQDLETIGLNKETDGTLSIDKEVLLEAIESENPSQRLSVLNDFKKALDERASVATLNPMDYVNKVVVAYKNPMKTFNAPYSSSIYAGMMLDFTC